MKRSNLSILTLFFTASIAASGQQQLNLVEELEGDRITVVNRTISKFEDSPGAVEMDAMMGDGLAILEQVEFGKGTIEVELLGENSPGRSFIGIAFNIRDERSYEAIYFRPFNFVAEAQANREHMVQYICHPDFTWSRLREERTGEFENEIALPPDPDDWFKAVITISEDQVKVYLDSRTAPILEVERLTNTDSGRIGLWTGNGSSGRFRNLRLLTE